MQTKPLLYGIIGFMLGGLIVSIAAAAFESPKVEKSMDMVGSLQGKAGDDFDRAFVGGMIAHHQDAIDMAHMAQTQAGHQEVKNLSKAIIEAQQKEIDQMKQWQQDWGYGDSRTKGMNMESMQ